MPVIKHTTQATGVNDPSYPISKDAYNEDHQVEYAFRTLTGATTLDATDDFVECTSGSYTITLPTAVGFKHPLFIKNFGAEGDEITVDGDGSETIDGELNVILRRRNAIMLVSDDTNWKIY